MIADRLRLLLGFVVVGCCFPAGQLVRTSVGAAADCGSMDMKVWLGRYSEGCRWVCIQYSALEERRV